MKKFAIAAFLLAASAVAAFADIPNPNKTPTKPPKQNPSVETTLSIRLDQDAKEAKLVIPRDQLKELRAAIDAADSGGTTAVAGSTGISRLQTIVAGFFLSLAVAFGGVLFARSRRTGSRVVAAGMVVFAALSGAMLVFGNAGPPAEARTITGKMFTPAVHMYGFGYGRVKMEVSDDAQQLVLIVPDPKPATPAE